MKRRFLCLSALLAFGLVISAAAPSAAARPTGYHRFTCSNDAELRIIFDEDEGVATVVRYRRPAIRLQRAPTAQGASAEDEFRYVRGETYELRGAMTEVRWRVGRGEWVCTRGR